MNEIKKEDVKLKMVMHIDFDDSHLSTYRDDVNGITVSIKGMRKKGAIGGSTEYFTDRLPNQSFKTVPELIEAHNKAYADPVKTGFGYE